MVQFPRIEKGCGLCRDRDWPQWARGEDTSPKEEEGRGVMTIINEIDYERVTDPDDPDDYRPGSRLAFVFDPGDESGRAVRNLHFIYEIAPPGDAAPLHVHPVDDTILVILRASSRSDTQPPPPLTRLD
jgi:hypothetical protein